MNQTASIQTETRFRATGASLIFDTCCSPACENHRVLLRPSVAVNIPGSRPPRTRFAKKLTVPRDSYCSKQCT